MKSKYWPWIYVAKKKILSEPTDVQLTFHLGQCLVYHFSYQVPGTLSLVHWKPLVCSFGNPCGTCRDPFLNGLLWSAPSQALEKTGRCLVWTFRPAFWHPTEPPLTLGILASAFLQKAGRRPLRSYIWGGERTWMQPLEAPPWRLLSEQLLWVMWRDTPMSLVSAPLPWCAGALGGRECGLYQLFSCCKPHCLV